MFEKIVIRRHDVEGEQIDAGRLAETLLFYDNVHILFDHASLISVLKTVGIDNLLLLLKQKRITATYLVDLLCTRTESIGGFEFYDYNSIIVTTHADGRKFKRKDPIIHAFEQALGNSRLTHIRTDQFLKHLSFRNYNRPEVDAEKSGIAAVARHDLEDDSFVRHSVEVVLRHYVPDYELPPQWFFRVRSWAERFVVETNLDYRAINNKYRAMNLTTIDTITTAWILTQILDARGDLSFAADYMSELVTDQTKSELIKLRFADFLRRQNSSTREIQAFQNLNLKSSTAIRETINSGERSFSEFIKLLDRASKFREWLHTSNPDESLLDTYYEASTADTWAQKLPTKATRFAVCTLAGVTLEALWPSGLGMTAGIGIGALDAMYLDKLIQGWRPSHFIDGPLKRFVDND